MSLSSLPADAQALFALLLQDGSSVGYIGLRSQLDWDEARYHVAWEELDAAGLVSGGLGKGGSLAREGAAPAALGMLPFVAVEREMFAAEKVTAFAPVETAAAPKAKVTGTAYVAKQLGRRWITIDSSRVAAAIARQRLLTACFDTFKTKDPSAGVDPNAPLNLQHGFSYKLVPHITLKSIAQNKGLDPIFARHEQVLAEKLTALNAALSRVTPALHETLATKLISKHRTDGVNAVTHADQCRSLLPGTAPALIQAQPAMKPFKGMTTGQVKAYREAIPQSSHLAPRDEPSASQTSNSTKDGSDGSEGSPQLVSRSETATMPSRETATFWQEWEMPFDTDPDWPKELAEALTAYSAVWRAKMDEVNACIHANVEQEDLVDQPLTVPGIVRVSGPFKVESMRPLEDSMIGAVLEEPIPIGGAPDVLRETFDGNDPEPEDTGWDVMNASSHIDRMIALLRHDGGSGGAGYPAVGALRDFRLESSEVVKFYVPNDHLDFSIPYKFMGVSHAFFPDFIVRLTNGVNLMLEVKGFINEQQKAKFEAAKRWCQAVTNWGKAGRWVLHVSKDPETVKLELKHLTAQ